MGRWGVLLLVAIAGASAFFCLAAPGWGAELQLLNEWGGSGSGPGQFSNAGDLEIAPDGNVVVSDSDNRRVQIFTQTGAQVTSFGSSGSGPSQFQRAAGVAIQSDGTIYVADSGSGRVQSFSPAGSYLGEFTLSGAFPSDLALDLDQTHLYASDHQASVISYVTTAGASAGQFGSPGAGPGQFARPLGIAVDSVGNLYVADHDNNRIQVLTATGTFVNQFGGLGSAPGQMSGPNDVAIAPDGDVYVADGNNFRLQRFTSGGAFVESYDAIAGDPFRAIRPSVVTVAPSGDIFMIDATNQHVLRVSAAPTAAPPQLAKTVTAGLVSGRVRVRDRGEQRFHALADAETIPVGSSIDTSNGRVSVTSATKTGGTQTAEFYDGRFQVGQARSGLTTLSLQGGNFRSCPNGSRVALGKRRRRLWGDGKGHFQSKGNHGSASVRGTIWLTQDTCRGTLFRVKQGVVRVRDFTRKRTVVVRAGERYLAPAR